MRQPLHFARTPDGFPFVCARFAPAADESVTANLVTLQVRLGGEERVRFALANSKWTACCVHLGPDLICRLKDLGTAKQRVATRKAPAILNYTDLQHSETSWTVNKSGFVLHRSPNNTVSHWIQRSRKQRTSTNLVTAASFSNVYVMTLGRNRDLFFEFGFLLKGTYPGSTKLLCSSQNPILKGPGF